MKDRIINDVPLLFSAPMIHALLGGRKTQTRRVISPRNTRLDGRPWPKGWWQQMDWASAWVDPGPSPVGNLGPYLKVPRIGHETVHRVYPMFWPGLNIWVKETHSFVGTLDPGLLVTRADYPDCVPAGYENVLPARSITWKPSIFMRRRDSRIVLPVQAVKLERLQDIGEDDAKAEGLSCLSKDDGRTWKWGIPDRDGWPGTDDVGWHWQYWNTDPRRAYAHLWDSINGEDAWAENPWVIAPAFTVERRNIDARI